ncbi:MAG TPA: LysM peptidoglycan-binding domain-containing protein [Acidimicrobiales bacterium]|nr:LysM peptidoglycan-binding domain-containing protein [Acidimicrobiales bacterium]
MPRARTPNRSRALVCASIVLAVCVFDSGLALAADPGDATIEAAASPRYQVRKGDSLTAIARRNGVTVAALAAANGIHNVHLIRIGQWLVIPGPGVAAASPAPPPLVAPAVAPTPDVAPVVYVLKSGDSLSRVAKRFKVTVGAIVTANEIANPNRVSVGLRLVIPIAGAVSAAATTTSPVTTAPATAPTTTVDPTRDAMAAAVAGATSTDSSTTSPTTTSPTTIAIPTTMAAPPAGVTLTQDQLQRLPPELLAMPDRLALMPVFDRWAAEYGLNPSLLKALAWMESGWQASVVSSAGAVGIGQLLPGTAAFLSVLIGEPLDPYAAEDNIRMSARYLSLLLGLTAGDVNQALAGYYQGLTSVRRDGMKATTAAYVNTVLALQGRF